MKTGTRTQVPETAQVGDVQDLARLVAQLLLLVGLERAVVDERPCERHDVEGDRHGIHAGVRDGDRAPVEGEPRGVTGGYAPRSCPSSSCTPLPPEPDTAW